MTLDVGVVGVGSMGLNHARVYDQIRRANLVGVADADVDRAESVAARVGTEALRTDELLARVDAVSVVTPTEYHASVVESCIDHGVDVLVEKPFVTSPERGRALLSRAQAEDVTVQVGHVERFNPAVTELSRIAESLSPIAIEARRLGPPPDTDRDLDDVVLDLMIHDIDVAQSLVSQPVVDVNAAEAANGRYTTAQLQFGNGTVASLTASRVTQQKVRELAVTTEECYVELDYIEQSIEIHRRSRPEYLESEGNLSYRHEGVTERPLVPAGEPLKLELESFVETIESGDVPRVTGRDGVRAVALANTIQRAATGADGVRGADDAVIESVETNR
jgi:predicted dehydrogenase